MAKELEEKAATRLEKERANFKMLILENPNYFGNIPESSYKAVAKNVGNTKYEELTCIGFNPDTNQLEATIAVKLPYGYGGNLCQAGSNEYVRFFLDYGGGWKDAGVVAVNVHDIPNNPDCATQPNKPLSYTVTLKLDPKTDRCDHPILPKVRAILSWEVIPPAGAANAGWMPVWGNTIECHIQIKPRKKNFVDLVDIIGVEIGKPVKLPVEFEPVAVKPIPLPDPPPFTLAELANMYKQTTAKGVEKISVQPHRFGFDNIHTITASATFSQEMVSSKIAEWKSLGLDWQEAVAALAKTKADVSYEELECLGLDYNLEKLVATFRIKRPTGYSGDLCHKGSFEYVAFWADWDDTCKWTYLDTVAVNVHDISSIPPEGLCYSAILPVDLTHHRRNCEKPKIGRVRAVLSWAVPPSTVDPDVLTHWGNRLDNHVQIKPGESVPEGTVKPIIWKLGGIHVNNIDANGLTTASAQFENGLPPDSLGRPCPFGGRVVVKGPSFPGFMYRVRVKKTTEAAWVPVVTKLHLEPLPAYGPAYDKNAATPDGYFTYETLEHNPDMILAWWDTTGDDLWDVRLEISGVLGVDEHKIQLDNTSPEASINIDPTIGGDCHDFTIESPISGNFVARDIYFGSFRLYTLPFSAPAGQLVPSTGTVQTLATGNGWKLDTKNMKSCGYVTVVEVVDRAIVNSSWDAHHWNYASVGWCLREKV